MTSAPQQFEELGVVTTGSGILLVIDTGCLNLWSHDRHPVLPAGTLDSDEQMERANSFVDLQIVGRDAKQAGSLLGMSWHPLYVYDQPPDHSDLQEKLKTVLDANRLEAHFEVISPRIPHLQRVHAALQHGNGAGEIQFHGIWAAAVAGVPTEQRLKVLGLRSATEPDRWARVLIDCRPHTTVARSEPVGCAGVDYARLLIADVEVLGAWKHEESRDGLADYVFWGRDAKQAATALNAHALDGEEYGWMNVPVDLALKRGLAVQEYRDQNRLKFAGDFRPHSDHWRVMTPTRLSPTESATVELAGNSICNFMTTWGDGVFDVYRDLDNAGQLIAIRIELEGNAS